MRELIMDGANWNSQEDVYDTFFEVLAHPHGMEEIWTR
jgi:hypothetical protein